MPRTWFILALAGGLLLQGCATGPEPHGDPPPITDAADDEVAELATGLDTVWEIAFSPDGRIFLTERPGRIVVMDEATGFEGRVWATVPVEERGESGLMGLALHPDFPDEPYVYISYTFQNGPQMVNRIARWVEEDDRGREDRVLVDDIPAASIHDGSRLAFGPDGMLYATTGDAANPANSQDPNSSAGKVLRIRPDGGVPADNPDNDSYVYTLGHRNPQGLDFHPDTDVPYITEHGPENHDEVNVLRPGRNYGWPAMRGTMGSPVFEPAIWSSGSGGTVAPAGAAFIDAPDSPLHGAFVFATLKERQVHVLEFADGDPTRVVDEHVIFDNEWGRLRALTLGPDDAVYIGTSNKDGRGNPGAQDDKVLRVPLAVLERAVAEGNAS